MNYFYKLVFLVILITLQLVSSRDIHNAERRDTRRTVKNRGYRTSAIGANKTQELVISNENVLQEKKVEELNIETSTIKNNIHSTIQEADSIKSINESNKEKESEEKVAQNITNPHRRRTRLIETIRRKSTSDSDNLGKVASPNELETVATTSSNDQTNSNRRKSFPKRPYVPILDMKNYVFSHRGKFHYSYENADGTAAFERGELRQLDDDTKGPVVVGGYTYTDKTGQNISLSYTADENGYRPYGDHLPTPPPIPPGIARALAYLASNAPEFTTESFAKYFEYDDY